VVLAERNRRALKEQAGLVIWLRADPAVLAGRVVVVEEGPVVVVSDPAGTLVRLATERTPLYAEVADVTVDEDTKTPDQIADEILA
jgi:shikimate kinase